MLALSESVTEVRTNIYVTSFGPVSDTDMVCVFLLLLLFLKFHIRFCQYLSAFNIMYYTSTRYGYMYCNW